MDVILSGGGANANPPTNRNNQHPVCPPPPNRGWCDGGGQTQATEPGHLWGAYRGWTAFVITVLITESCVIIELTSGCNQAPLKKQWFGNAIYHLEIITHENGLIFNCPVIVIS